MLYIPCQTDFIRIALLIPGGLNQEADSCECAKAAIENRVRTERA